MKSNTISPKRIYTLKLLKLHLSNLKVKSLALLLPFVLTGCSNPSLVEQFSQKQPAFYAYITGPIDSKHFKSQASKVPVSHASCQKVMTASIALQEMGRDFRFKTILYERLDNRQEVVYVLKGFGDPNLSSDDLVSLLKHITLPGTLQIDASHFKQPSYSPNLMVNDLGSSYANPVSSLNLDHNLVSVHLSANKETITTIPDYPTTIQEIKENTSKIKLAWDDESIKVLGDLNKESSTITLELSPLNHQKFIQKKISQLVSQYQIPLTTITWLEESIPEHELREMATHQSEPLHKTMIAAMHNSDNLYFDSIYLSLIANQNPNAQLWEDGDPIIKDLIQKHFGISMDRAYFVDGSGLSRYNRFESQQLFNILKQAYQHPEFTNTLIIPGTQNSTLAKSLLPKEMKAKTGSMTGIYCLCGYILSPTPAAFVYLAHGIDADKSEMEQNVLKLLSS
jgi:serine-type D-Ala-D-Ala carboxypeptidase/endopeptidase (penicillin-binding protein 4)